MWYSSATFAAATASVGIALASVAVNVVYGTFETISLALLLKAAAAPLLPFCSLHFILGFLWLLSSVQPAIFVSF